MNDDVEYLNCSPDKSRSWISGIANINLATVVIQRVGEVEHGQDRCCSQPYRCIGKMTAGAHTRFSCFSVRIIDERVYRSSVMASMVD
jgi:hypothetical protein